MGKVKKTEDNLNRIIAVNKQGKYLKGRGLIAGQICNILKSMNGSKKKIFCA